MLGTSIINIPFGYFREGVKKFSILWFVYIHAPVPLVILLRKSMDIQLSWTIAPFLIGSYFLGQYVGKLLKRYKISTNSK